MCICKIYNNWRLDRKLFNLHSRILILSIRHVIPDNRLRVSIRGNWCTSLLIISFDHDRYNVRATSRLRLHLILRLILHLILHLIPYLTLILNSWLTPSLLMRTRLLELMMARFLLHVENRRPIFNLEINH